MSAYEMFKNNSDQSVTVWQCELVVDFKNFIFVPMKITHLDCLIKNVLKSACTVTSISLT